MIFYPNPCENITRKRRSKWARRWPFSTLWAVPLPCGPCVILILVGPLSYQPPDLTRHYPAINGEWINFYDADDVIGFPLRSLNAAYLKVVKKDVPVNTGSFLISWTPLLHLEYWTDDGVLGPIARSLARAWKKINDY